jgi:hypothetical protein
VAVVVAVVVPVAAVVPGATPAAMVTVLPVAEFVPGAVVVAHITAAQLVDSSADPLAAVLGLVARTASPCPAPSRRTIVAFPVRLSTSMMTPPVRGAHCDLPEGAVVHVVRLDFDGPAVRNFHLCDPNRLGLVMCIFTTAAEAAGLAARCGELVADTTPATGGVS